MRGKGEGNIWERTKGVFVARLTVSYNEQGNPKRVTKTFTIKKDDRRWLADQQTQLSAGSLADVICVTVADWITNYLVGLTLRANMLHAYTKTLEPVKESLGRVRLREFTPALMQQHLNTWRTKRMSYQNRKTMKILKRPAAPVRLTKVEAQAILVWWPEEATVILDKATAVDHLLCRRSTLL